MWGRRGGGKESKDTGVRKMKYEYYLQKICDVCLGYFASTYYFSNFRRRNEKVFALFTRTGNFIFENCPRVRLRKAPPLPRKLTEMYVRSLLCCLPTNNFCSHKTHKFFTHFRGEKARVRSANA